MPIVVKREVEGFILNRLQAVLLSEAFHEDGYVTPQDLDKTLKDGLGLRWSFMGPFETIELNAPDGIADYCRRYGPSLSRLSAADSSIYDGERPNDLSDSAADQVRAGDQPQDRQGARH